MNLKQIDDLAMQAANYIEELQKRIAELEAENAELKRAHASQLKANVDLYRAIGDVNPTREQIAALVKGLEWQGPNGRFNYGFYHVYIGPVSGAWRLNLRSQSGEIISEKDVMYHTSDEARAAAETHHKETVLNLLNLPA